MHLSAFTGAGYPLVLPLARGHFDSTQSILMLGVATGISRLLAFFSLQAQFVRSRSKEPTGDWKPPKDKRLVWIEAQMGC